MTTKHTPGEWEAIESLVRSTSTHVEIAHCKYGTREETHAHARLIAAGPELLEELKDALRHICYLCKRLNPQHENCTSCDDMGIRRQILAKAGDKS